MNITANIIRRLARLILPVAAAAAFGACDTVPVGDRYIELPELTNIERTVLLQDFTGQNCVNCPAAHEVMELLKEQYGDHLICVSIHAGSLAIPVKNTNFAINYVGLKTEDGDIYNDAAGVVHWPMGTVDRGPALDPDQWATAVREQLSKATDAKIDLSAELIDDTIYINSELLASDDFTGKYQLWVLQSGIVARQRSEKGLDTEYVHNNVFRAAVNGVWGQDVQLKEGIRTTLENNIAMVNTDKEVWVAENMTIVGFIYDDSGVQQAASCKLQIK